MIQELGVGLMAQHGHTRIGETLILRTATIKDFLFLGIGVLSAGMLIFITSVNMIMI